MSPSAELPFDPIEEARRHWDEHGWRDAAAGMAAVTSIMRAQQIVQGRVDAVLRPLGLTFSRYELLMLLHFSNTGALPVTKASSRLQVHPTSVTNSVQRLESAGLVHRSPHPSDRRATLVTITEEGRRIGLAATDLLNAAVFRFPGLPDRRNKTLIAVLADLRRSAGDFA